MMYGVRCTVRYLCAAVNRGHNNRYTTVTRRVALSFSKYLRTNSTQIKRASELAMRLRFSNFCPFINLLPMNPTRMRLGFN